MWALLIRRFEGDFTRQRFLDMDDWELMNVLCRPDFHDGDVERGYWPVPRMSDANDPGMVETGPRGVFYNPKRIEAMKTLGMTDAEIEAKFQDWAQQFKR